MALGSKRGDKAPGPAPGGAASAPPASPGAKPATQPASGAGGSAPSRAPARSGDRPGTMIPARSARSAFESVFMRLIATAGIVGVSVAVAAIMGSSNSQSWIIGLVVSLISVVMAAVLWSSRRL